MPRPLRRTDVVPDAISLHAAARPAMIQTDLLAKIVLTVADQHKSLTLAGIHAPIAGSNAPGRFRALR